MIPKPTHANAPAYRPTPPKPTLADARREQHTTPEPTPANAPAYRLTPPKPTLTDARQEQHTIPKPTPCGCPAGQTLVTASDSSICLPSAATQTVMDCQNANWLVLLNSPDAFCSIPYLLYGADQAIRTTDTDCLIHGTSDKTACAELFGDPPNFPNANDHPNVVVSGNTDDFVANCDLDGNAPGGYPPDHNTGGATECICGDGYLGTWPACVAIPNLRLRLRLFLEGPLR